VQEPAVTSDIVHRVEQEIGYRLPEAYIELAKLHNGGYVTRGAHAIPSETGRERRYLLIDRIASIGYAKRDSLCGHMGSRFWQDTWGYPDIGVYFGVADGHEIVCLDYRVCGPQGEPTVVLVEQEYDYRVTEVAPSFQAFIMGLRELEYFLREQ
jgi:hypothetical protein